MKKLVIAAITLFFVLIAVVVFAFVQFKPVLSTSSQSTNSVLLQERIVEISELATLKSEYTKAMVLRDDRKLPLVSFNYAEEIKVVEYSGYLKAGSDLSGAETDYDEEANRITVKVPKAKILDNVIDFEKMKIDDVKGSIFIDSTTQDLVEEVSKEAKKFEDEKVEAGFLAEADKRTEEVLKSFLGEDEDTEIVVEFY